MDNRPRVYTDGARRHNERVIAVAKFIPGEEARYFGAPFAGEVVVVEEVITDHTHGGSRAKPWWTLHEDACYVEERLDYCIAFREPTGLVSLRLRCKGRELKSL